MITPLNPNAPIVGPGGLPSPVFTVLMHQLTKKLRAEVTYNPPSLNTLVGTTTNVTLAGVDFLYEVGCAFSLDTQGVMLNANVQSAGTVTVSLFNATSGTVNLGAGTLSVWARLP
jgi:hypothetical protein